MDRREFFDHHAAAWDKEINQVDARKIRKILKLAGIGKDDLVLDLACGTGVILPFLKELVDGTKKITALDISSKMLAEAKKKFGDEFAYVVADAHDLSFDRDSFSKVICYNAFPHFQDKPKALSEIFRALKSKGSFIITHSASRKEINNLHKNVGSAVKNDRIPGTEKMLFLLQNTGFTDTRVMDEKDFYFASGIKLQ